MNVVSLYEFINIISPREQAILIWVLMFSAWCFYSSKRRVAIIKAFKGVLQALLAKVVILSLISVFIYVSFVVSFLYKMSLWDLSLLKETVCWTLFSAITLLVGASASKDLSFKKKLFDSVKLVIIIEFIVETYTFNLMIELFIVPVTILVSNASAYLQYKKDFQTKKIADTVLLLIGIILLINASYSLISHYEEFVAFQNLKRLLLIPLLMIMYIPFLYCFSLYIAYDAVCRRIDIAMSGDRSLSRMAKINALILCGANLNRLSALRKVNMVALMKLKNRSDLSGIIV